MSEPNYSGVFFLRKTSTQSFGTGRALVGLASNKLYRKFHFNLTLPKASHRGEDIMLSWGITFLVLALIVAVLGFGVLSGAAMTAAKVCIGVFLVLAVISMITGRRVTG